MSDFLYQMEFGYFSRPAASVSNVCLMDHHWRYSVASLEEIAVGSVYCLGECTWMTCSDSVIDARRVGLQESAWGF